MSDGVLANLHFSDLLINYYLNHILFSHEILLEITNVKEKKKRTNDVINYSHKMECNFGFLPQELLTISFS